MSNPENSATQQEPVAPVEVSLEEKLRIAEQRQKDTQAAYTKGQQAIKALEAEKNKLLELASSQTRVTLTPAEQEALDALKFDDPVEWRKQLNSLENKATLDARVNLTNLTGEAKKAAEQEFELSRRQQVLEEFNASAEVPITEELIGNEVPPRITKKLAEGTISFEEFLSEVHTYVTTGKVVKNDSTLDQPNLGNTGGSTTPKDSKPDVSLSKKYENDIY